LPALHNQCFRCLATDHHVEACRDPVRGRQCLRYGHRSASCTMAGPSAFWARVARRATFSSSEDSASPRPRAPAPPGAFPAGDVAVWRSPTIDQRGWGTGPLPPSPATHSRSRSPATAWEQHRPHSVRFAGVTPPSAASPVHHPQPRRAWRAATPFLPTHAASPAGTDVADGDDYAEVHMPPVDMEPTQRLAYAFVDPECADPGLYIRTALEQRGGDLPSAWLPPPTGP